MIMEMRAILSEKMESQSRQHLELARVTVNPLNLTSRFIYHVSEAEPDPHGAR
jgi:hypothetical protein